MALSAEQRRGHKAVPRKMSRITKRTVWLRHYLDESNPATFLNKVGSVKAAGYKCNGEPSCRSLGSENFTYHADIIGKWLDENGLSEEALKIKLLSLMDATEEKFFSAPVKDENGIVTHMHIESRIVPAIESQRKSLDMALKVKGMNAPTLHEHTGKDGKDLFPELSDEELDKRILALKDE